MKRIEDRIKAAYTPRMRYYELEQAVFPQDDYPQVLMSALRRYGYMVSDGYVGSRVVYRQEESRRG
jgi:hypothetical protein